MTISSQANKVVYQGNGATTVFSYDFIVPDGTDLIVTLITNASGDSSVIAPINYTVTGIGDDAGGTVTYPLSGSALSIAYTLVIQRTVSYVQETDLVNQGAAYPAVIETALDFLTMQTQQLATLQAQSIVFSSADTVITPLPVASARANLLLGFDSSGNPTAVAGIVPSVTVSAAMIPVVTAATTAAALTALGIPGSLLDLLIPSGVEWPYHAGESAITGFVFPVGQACTSAYPNYRAKLIAAGSPYGTNGTDPLMPDRRSTVYAVKSNMGGTNNGLLTGGTVLGAVLGGQTNFLATGNLPAYTPAGTIASPPHTHPGGSEPYRNFLTGAGAPALIRVGDPPPDGNSTMATSGATTITATFTGTAQGGLATPFSIVQPTFVCNCILKVH